MSKRFGRNQRRQARERIAKLEAALVETTGLMVFQRNRADMLGQRIEDWAYRIRKVVGDEHPMNERIKQRVVKAIPHGLRTVPPLRLSEVLRVHDPVPFESAMTYIDLVRLELEATREPPPNVGRAVVELRSEQGRSALFIDREYFNDLRRDDPEVRRWVAQRVAEQLTIA